MGEMPDFSARGDLTGLVDDRGVGNEVRRFSSLVAIADILMGAPL
jgi:hypothetical protein